VEVIEDDIVPEAEHRQAISFEAAGSGGVVSDLVGMTAAVEFNDKSRFNADEVEDEGRPGFLPPPPPSAKSPVPEHAPEGGLGARIVEPEVACPVNQLLPSRIADDAHG
jgi:hypothetical protein